MILAVGYGGYALVESAWQASSRPRSYGIGNGAFWPVAVDAARASLTPATQRPAAFAMQRVTMNLGIGARRPHRRPRSPDRRRASALLFLARRAHVPRLRASCSGLRARAAPARGERAARGRQLPRRLPPPASSWALMLAERALHRRRASRSSSCCPPTRRTTRGVERAAGSARSSSSTRSSIVLAQLPIARLARGPPADARRSRSSASSGPRRWLLVPAAGSGSTGSGGVRLLAVAVALFGVGECLHGAVAGAARRRPRRPPADRPLHGALGALLAGRLHGRAGGRRRRCSPPRRPGSGSSPRRAASSPARPRSRSSARLPERVRRTPRGAAGARRGTVAGELARPARAG